MTSAPPAAGQVHLDHVPRSQQRLDQPRGSHEHAIRADADGKVAVLPRDEPPPGQLAAALGHAPGHRVGRHRPGRASTWCTTVPPTRVSAARPVSVRPANGVLRLFESSVSGCTVQRVVVSSTTTSATAPGCNVPPGRRNTVAGGVLIRARIVGGDEAPPRPNPVCAAPDAVPRGQIPDRAASEAALLA